MKDRLEIGEVVQTKWDSRPLKVIAWDDIEVFYDCWWPELGKWTFGAVRRKAIYYRMSVRRFVEGMKRLRMDPVTAEARELHRPDLPLRLYRTKSFSWASAAYSSRAHFGTALESAGVVLADLGPLQCSSVALLPRTQRGACGLPCYLRKDQGTAFSALDVLWAAYKAQRPYQNRASDGIGLFRSGLAAKGIPSFYVGEYHDVAGITREFGESR
jgi:hypothetical protein